MLNLMFDNIFQRSRHHNLITELVANCYLFRDLNRRELQILEQNLHLREFQAGEGVFYAGEIGVGMFLILSGEVKIFFGSTADSSVSGPTISLLKAGDFFGEVALAEVENIRVASAQATQDSRVLAFMRPDLISLSESFPRMGQKIFSRLSEVLAKRLNATVDDWLKISEANRP